MLGLGNELLADDAVGVLAARELASRLDGRADVVATSAHGVALLDLFEGYDGSVILDSVVTGRRPVGTVFDLDPARFHPVLAPSPHYAGIPEMLDLARRLELRFPERMRIVAMEVRDPLTLGGEMSPEVREALPALCERACCALDEVSSEVRRDGSANANERAHQQ